MMSFLSQVRMMKLPILDHPMPYKSPPARVREQQPSGFTSTLRCRWLVIDRIWIPIITFESWKSDDSFGDQGVHFEVESVEVRHRAAAETRTLWLDVALATKVLNSGS
ncbi:MAG: hypothetical protein OSB09_10045 [Planctomycetota bacterium]|nr:hypothetical protein [Planctomycetota bacterium]